MSLTNITNDCLSQARKSIEASAKYSKSIQTGSRSLNISDTMLAMRFQQNLHTNKSVLSNLNFSSNLLKTAKIDISNMLKLAQSTRQIIRGAEIMNPKQKGMIQNQINSLRSNINSKLNSKFFGSDLFNGGLDLKISLDGKIASDKNKESIFINNITGGRLFRSKMAVAMNKVIMDDANNSLDISSSALLQKAALSKSGTATDKQYAEMIVFLRTNHPSMFKDFCLSDQGYHLRIRSRPIVNLNTTTTLNLKTAILNDRHINPNIDAKIIGRIIGWYQLNPYKDYKTLIENDKLNNSHITDPAFNEKKIAKMIIALKTKSPIIFQAFSSTKDGKYIESRLGKNLSSATEQELTTLFALKNKKYIYATRYIGDAVDRGDSDDKITQKIFSSGLLTICCEHHSNCTRRNEVAPRIKSLTSDIIDFYKQQKSFGLDRESRISVTTRFALARHVMENTMHIAIDWNGGNKTNAAGGQKLVASTNLEKCGINQIDARILANEAHTICDTSKTSLQNTMALMSSATPNSVLNKIGGTENRAMAAKDDLKILDAFYERVQDDAPTKIDDSSDRAFAEEVCTGAINQLRDIYAYLVQKERSMESHMNSIFSNQTMTIEAWDSITKFDYIEYADIYAQYIQQNFNAISVISSINRVRDIISSAAINNILPESQSRR
jgi:hypothetical protein